MDFVRLTQLCKQMKGEATGLCRTSRTSLKVYYNNNKKRQQREAPRAFQEPSELEAARLRASFSPCKAVLTRRAGKQEQEPVLCVPRPGGTCCPLCWLLARPLGEFSTPGDFVLPTTWDAGIGLTHMVRNNQSFIQGLVIVVMLLCVRAYEPV